MLDKLLARRGQLNIAALIPDTDVAANAKRAAGLRERASQLSKLYQSTMDRYYASQDYTMQEQLLKEATAYQESSSEARAAAERLEGNQPTSGPNESGDLFGPGSPAASEFEATTSAPIEIPKPGGPGMMEQLSNFVSRFISKPQNVDVPIKTDLSTPLPDLAEHATSKKIFSQPFGFERIPVLGWAFGGLRRVAGTIPESVVTYFGELNVGRAIGSALGLEYNWLDKPFKIEKTARSSTSAGRRARLRAFSSRMCSRLSRRTPMLTS